MGTFSRDFQELWQYISMVYQNYQTLAFMGIGKYTSRGYTVDINEINHPVFSEFKRLSILIASKIKSNIDEGSDFLIFLLDQPLPLLWPEIIKIAEKIDCEILQNRISTFDNPMMNGSQIKSIINLNEQVKRYMNIKKTLEYKLENYSGEPSEEREFFQRLFNQEFDYNLWFPIIWKRISRNKKALLSQTPENFVEVDRNQLSNFLSLVGRLVQQDNIEEISP
ncbi:MAG: hypothetical protein INQ03_21285 [Candidatus Heimdallarchaeota archaeon]|nr:hypothetical protein [Candidatus Heimdallarchaeota archaeon]